MNSRFESYVNGLTPAKRLIAREAVSEYLKGESEPMNILDSSLKLYKQVRHLSLEKEECGYVILMKQNYRLIKTVEISHGGLTTCLFDIRVIMREAIVNNATVIAIVHNHPSGSIRPSKEDDSVTKKVRKACQVVGIHFCDHIIVGDNCYYSYADEGR